MTILRKNRLTTVALPEYERLFKENLVDDRLYQWEKKEPVYGNAIGIQKDSGSFFYEEKTKKERIVLHGTHGILSNDVANLSKSHVSTSYLIARSGDVYELFSPEFWSYHLGSLGKRSWTTNTKESKKTIAIELSNIGNLKEHKKNKDILLDGWGFPYCMKSQDHLYVKSEYRNNLYYSTYTEEQYKSLDSLLMFLCRRFGIVHSFLKKEERMDIMDSVPSAGIVSHVNYRYDKVDISPAFDWDLISGR